MPITIDKYDASVYDSYAKRVMTTEQINQQLRLDQAKSVSAHSQVLDIYPKPTEIELLMGIAPLATPWALFYPPSKFPIKRRSPFGFARLLPSLFSSQEEQDHLEHAILSTTCRTDKEEAEKKALLNCINQIGKLNQWLGHIVGRVGQFLQG